MEFLFALTKLRIPVVLAVVGTSYKWEGTEVCHLCHQDDNLKLSNTFMKQFILSLLRLKTNSCDDNIICGIW